MESDCIITSNELIPIIFFKIPLFYQLFVFVLTNVYFQLNFFQINKNSIRCENYNISSFNLQVALTLLQLNGFWCKNYLVY